MNNEQRIFVYWNDKTREFHVAQHDVNSKNIGIKINKGKAEYAKKCQAAGLLRTNGSSHAYNSGFIVALMNSVVDDWREDSRGIFDTNTCNIVQLKKDIAAEYESNGFICITSVFKKSRTSGKSSTPTAWAGISANRPWPKFEQMCHNMCRGSGNTPDINLIREVYHMVIHPDAIDYTKADIRDFFVTKGVIKD